MTSNSSVIRQRYPCDGVTTQSGSHAATISQPAGECPCPGRSPASTTGDFMQSIHKPPDKVRGTMPTSPSAYDADFFRWTEEQRQHLLDRNYAQLDWDNLAEEVLSMGKPEVKALESSMAVLLAHLLKWAWHRICAVAAGKPPLKNSVARLRGCSGKCPASRPKLAMNR